MRASARSWPAEVCSPHRNPLDGPLDLPDLPDPLGLPDLPDLPDPLGLTAGLARSAGPAAGSLAGLPP
ncbi:MAG TPA: hypothetical protein VHX38_15600 [Pseudonocardiaceae bacterium]|nr:hypothetical protein [Pseudonocardiaceae bacterium]